MGSAAARSSDVLEDHLHDRRRRDPGHRDLGQDAPQPRPRLLAAHESATPLCDLEPPPGVFLIELGDQAGPLRPLHSGLDLRDRRLGAPEDNGVLGKLDAGRSSSRLKHRRSLVVPPRSPPGLGCLDPHH
jgi:hypothetical protein